MSKIAIILNIPATSFFTHPRQQAIAEEILPYSSPDEKTLLRHYRNLPAQSDKSLAVTIIRRLAKK